MKKMRKNYWIEQILSVKVKRLVFLLTLKKQKTHEYRKKKRCDYVTAITLSICIVNLVCVTLKIIDEIFRFVWVSGIATFKPLMCLFLCKKKKIYLFMGFALLLTEIVYYSPKWRYALCSLMKVFSILYLRVQKFAQLLCSQLWKF